MKPALALVPLMLTALAACERPMQAQAPAPSRQEAKEAVRAACKGDNRDEAKCEAARQQLQQAKAQGRGARGEAGSLRMGTRLGLHAMRMGRRGGF